ASEISSILLTFARDPFADVGRAAEQLGPLPLAFVEEPDDLDADYGDFLQVDRGARTAHLQLARDLFEIVGPHAPDEPESGPPAIRLPLELQRHRGAASRRGGFARRAPGAGRNETKNKPSEDSDGSEKNADHCLNWCLSIPSAAIFESSVCLGIPNLVAAPNGPATRPFDSFSAAPIFQRSPNSVPVVSVFPCSVAPAENQVGSTESVSPSQRMTA